MLFATIMFLTMLITSDIINNNGEGDYGDYERDN